MKVTVYTKNIDNELCPFGLAKAVYFSVSNGGEDIPLNYDYAILFAEGVIADDNTIIPLGIDNVSIHRMGDGAICISGSRILEDGSLYEPDDGKCWSWKTKDLIHFELLGLADEVLKTGEASSKLEIEDSIALSAISFWNPAKLAEDLSEAKYSFPLAKGFGDPVIFPWEGKWYFISTSDNTHDVGIYVREADSVPGLFAKDVEQHLILPYDPDRELIQTFWAPEFHVIGGELYILFAVGGRKWAPQCHMMKFKRGGSIIDPASWSDPIKVVKKDGTPIGEGAITLDMTYIKAANNSYVVWSYREHIGEPLDTGSMLMIATIDEKEPWKLTSDPVLLSRPVYGWENLQGTINNEAPYAYIRDGKIYMTYSGGAANGFTYAVGLFTADVDADLLDTSVWTRSTTPILNFHMIDEFGPGHNSFYTDENGKLMIAYHAESSPDSHLRCDMIRRVYFKEDGTPYFV